MGLVDSLTPAARHWRRHSDACRATMLRAAMVQVRALGIANPMALGEKLITDYSLDRRSLAWREFGDVAFRLLSEWPPDLAYLVLYSTRESSLMRGRDVVPLILKSVEMMPHLNPHVFGDRLSVSVCNPSLATDRTMRSRAAARLLAREISNVPLRWAAGIYREMDGVIKPFLDAELTAYNPLGSEILRKNRSLWLLTGTGILKGFLRLWFGRDHE